MPPRFVKARARERLLRDVSRLRVSYTYTFNCEFRSLDVLSGDGRRRRLVDVGIQLVANPI